MNKKFEERKEQLDNIVENYKMGFITAYEMICKVDQIAWTPLERIAIQRAIEDSMQLNIDAFEFAVKC